MPLRRPPRSRARPTPDQHAFFNTLHPLQNHDTNNSEFLESRQTEGDKAGKEWKYALVAAVVAAQKREPVLQEEVLGGLRAFLRQGASCVGVCGWDGGLGEFARLFVLSIHTSHCICM